MIADTAIERAGDLALTVLVALTLAALIMCAVWWLWDRWHDAR